MQIKREDLLEDWRDWLMKHSGPNYPEAKIEFLNLKHTRGEKINEPLSPDDLMQIKSPADYRKFEGLYTPQGQMLHDFLKRWKRPAPKKVKKVRKEKEEKKMKTLLLYWNEFIDHSPKYLKERISSDKIFDRDIGELMELWSKGEKAVKKQLKEEGVKQFPRDDAWDFLEFMSIRFNWKDLIAKEDTPRVENHRTFPSTVSDKTPEKEGEILRDILFKKVKECLRNADKLAMNILKYIIIFYFILNLSPSSPAEQKTTISEFVIPACSNNTQGLVSRCDPDNRCYTKYQLKPGDQCIDDSDCPVGTQCSQVNDNMLCVAPQQKNKPLPKCYYLDVEMYIDQDKVEEKYIYNPTNEERGCLFDSEINKSDKYLYHQRGTRRCYHKDEKDKYVKAKVGQCDNKGKMIR